MGNLNALTVSLVSWTFRLSFISISTVHLNVGNLVSMERHKNHLSELFTQKENTSYTYKIMVLPEKGVKVIDQSG